MEIERGTLQTIIWQGNGYLIGKLSTNIVIKGHCLAPNVGHCYELTGRWEVDPRFGRQFAFSDYRSLPPQTETAVRQYLMGFRWLGPRLSEAIVRRYGASALETCKQDPEQVADEVRGLTVERAREISEALRRNEANERLEVELKALLTGTKLTRTALATIVHRWGEEAPEVIRENPYALIDEVPGVGFLTADSIALRNGVARESPYRVQAGVVHALKAAAGEGSTCLPREVLQGSAGEVLGFDDPAAIKGQVDALRSADRLVVDAESCYLPGLYRDETYVAGKLGELIAAAPRLAAGEPRYEGLAPDQVEALRAIVASAVSVLTGGPGTGKTTTLKHVIESFPGARIALAAPTGRAAKRMYEQTGAEASTIHRLLEPRMVGGRFEFGRTEENPIEADLLIIDEVSMVDIRLMASLLRAVAPATRLLLVGDADQLPSVGPGRVLHDIIESCVVPSVELTEIKRQDPGLIVTNAHRIKNGLDVDTPNDPEADFFFLGRDSMEEIRDCVFELVAERLPEAYGADPWTEIQVISPRRSELPVSCDKLNQLFQDRMNPEPSHERTRFKVGDKVVQTKNDYGHGIINGDRGRIVSIDTAPKTVTVQFEDPPRLVELPLWENALELGYANSVHRSQGGEAPIVVIPIHRAMGTLLLQRNLLYTAVTRAKRVCVMVGQRSEIPKIVTRNRQGGRYSNLKRRLQRG